MARVALGFFALGFFALGAQQAGLFSAMSPASLRRFSTSRRNTGFSLTQSCRQARLADSSREGLGGRLQTTQLASFRDSTNPRERR